MEATVRVSANALRNRHDLPIAEFDRLDADAAPSPPPTSHHSDINAAFPFTPCRARFSDERAFVRRDSLRRHINKLHISSPEQ